MTLSHFEKAVSFFSPKNLIFVTGEAAPAAPEMYNQAEALERFAGEYREIPAGTRIDFTNDDGQGLVAKLVQQMKTMQEFKNLTDKQITGSAVAVVARMARAGAGHPGFDVNLFRKGSSVIFEGNNQVTIHYTNEINPSDAYETPATLSFDATLNLSKEAAHSGPVAASREARTGHVVSMLADAANSEVLYTVADILGYGPDRAPLMAKLFRLGFNNAKIQELAPELTGAEQKNRAACRFIKGLLRDAPDPRAVLDSLKGPNFQVYIAEPVVDEDWIPNVTGELPHGDNVLHIPDTSADPAEVQRNIEEAQRGFDEASVLKKPEPGETESETLRDILYIDPEVLRTTLQDALSQRFPGIQVSVPTDRKTGGPENPQLTLTGPAGTESGYVTNTGDRQDLAVWTENATKVAKRLVRQVGKMPEAE